MTEEQEERIVSRNAIEILWEYVPHPENFEKWWNGLDLAPPEPGMYYWTGKKWIDPLADGTVGRVSTWMEKVELAPKHTEESLRITIGLIGNKLEFAGKVRDRGRIEGVLQGLLYVVGDLVEWELPGFPWLTKDDMPEG